MPLALCGQVVVPRLSTNQADETVLAAKALGAAVNKSSQARYAALLGTPKVAIVAGKHGEKGFPALIGSTFSNGSCKVTAHWFSRSEDKDTKKVTVTYSRPYPQVGGMDNCSFVAFLKISKGAAQ